MTNERRPIEDQMLAGAIAWQLERMGQDMRNAYAKRKAGVEKVMAHMVVAALRRRDFQVDGPVHDPDGAIVGPAYPAQQPESHGP